MNPSTLLTCDFTVTSLRTSAHRHQYMDLKVHWYLTGDDEIQRGMRIFAEAGGELGYM